MRHIKFIIFLFFVILSLQTSAAILTGSCGDNATFVLNEDGSFHVNGYGEMSDYTSKDKRPWNSVCTQIKSLHISSGITSVGKYAFISCTNLTEAEFPNTVTAIRSNAFYGCSSLNDLSLPSSLLTIEQGAFEGCSSLQSLVIPDNVYSLGAYAFEDCKAIETLVLGNSVTELGNYVFQRCYGLTSVTIGKSVEELGTAFTNSSTKVNELIYAEGCTKAIKTNFSTISIVKLPSSLNEICDNAFYRFKKITNVDLPNNMTRIGDYAFFECEGLTSINIPSHLTYLGVAAFESCKKLSSDIIIPEGVKNIYERTFEICSSLSNVTLNQGIETIGKQAFYWCGQLETINFPGTLKSIGEEAFNDCEKITEVMLEEGITEIGQNAFVNCSGISKLSTPSTLISIGNSAFRNCSNLSELVFTNGLQSIGDHAFCGCNKLTSLKLPDSVVSIGETAFAGSDYGTGNHTYSLVQIGNGLKEISGVFWGMNHNQPKIESFVIGNGISSIHDYTPIFGSNYSDTWGSPVSYLLTNNKVDLYSWAYSGNNPHKPNCTIYVANVSKYSEDEIKKYGIKNIITSNTYNGEYNGLAPQINFVSNLQGYNAIIDPKYYNVGSYSSMEVNFSKEEFSASITVPCNYTITKAPLSIIANDKSVYYGEEIPELDCSYIGLKNNETPEYALSTHPSLVTSAKKGSNAGTYNINISGAVAKNYSLSYTSGTLTIKKAPQNITWNQTFNTCYIGDVVELNAISSSGLPITYISSNENIAFVTRENDKQLLYFVKDGTVKITATQQGNENYESAVEISKSFNVIAKVATNITLNQSSIRLKEGESATLVATIYPESVVEKGVEWSSSNKDVVIVNNGMVTAIKVGTATITARTIDGSNLEATCNVIVDPVLASAITLNTNSVSTTIGDSFSLTYEIKPENVTYKDVTWVSSNTDVATVEGGYVQTKAVGSALISVKTTDGTNLTATCNVTVNPILVSSINLSSSTLNLNVGEYATLSVTITPDNATNKNVEWSSSNSSIASVSNGIVTAITSGSCVIKAKTTDGSEIESSCVITVANIPVTNLILNKESIEILVDEEATITANVYPANATNQTLSWTSSNGNVATVDGGLVTARGAGETVITVRSTDGSDKMATCNVVVKKHQQTIEWNQDLSSIMYGGELIEIHAEASSGLPVVYSSSNDNVISIFDMGNVVYLNPINVGTSVITVTQAGNRYYEEISVSKEVKVIDPSGVNNIMASDGKYIVTSINGIRLGVFSEKDMKQFMVRNKGVFIINGKKTLIL